MTRWLDITLGLALAAILFSFSFREGWTRVETDFPNYYTGAAAARAGLPLKNFYDWTWFQREMNYTGTERQLGAYVPQTPLALVPFLPIAGLAPQPAKQVWLSLNAVLLGLTILLLVRITALPYRWVFLIFLAGYGSVHSNFLLGQYYIFLAFLLTLAVYLFFRGRETWSGATLGIIFILKLYSGPFLLFFLVKRHWRAAAAFACITVAGGFLSIAMFGWDANLYYARSILPSAIKGMLIDPYNPGHGSITALLRRTFVAEPELNPNPLINWSPAFTFSQTFFSLSVLLSTLFTLNRPDCLTKREFAWLIIALLLLSPVNATYTFVLLTIPIAILMPEHGTKVRILLLAALAITSTPLPREITIFFPRAITLALLFIYSIPVPRRARLQACRVGNRADVCLRILAIATPTALLLALHPLPHEPFERIIQPGYSLAVMEPALTKNGPVYHTFGDGRYVLHTPSRTYSFEGHAFHATANPGDGPVLFELVHEGHSQIMNLDLTTGEAHEQVPNNAQQPAISPDASRTAFIANNSLWIQDATGPHNLGIKGADPSFSADSRALLYAQNGKLYSDAALLLDGADLRHPAMSPDGTQLAYTSNNQIWIRHLPTGTSTQLTHAACNHDFPVWEADSRHLLFTSDCGRGLGLPALYRAEVSEIQSLRSQP